MLSPLLFVVFMDDINKKDNNRDEETIEGLHFAVVLSDKKENRHRK